MRETRESSRRTDLLSVGCRFLGVMPAYSKESESSSLGAKLVSFYSGNADLGLPTHTATIVLLDPRTGALLAVSEHVEVGFALDYLLDYRFLMAQSSLR